MVFHLLHINLNMIYSLMKELNNLSKQHNLSCNFRILPSRNQLYKMVDTFRHKFIILLLINPHYNSNISNYQIQNIIYIMCYNQNICMIKFIYSIMYYYLYPLFKFLWRFYYIYVSNLILYQLGKYPHNYYLINRQLQLQDKSLYMFYFLQVKTYLLQKRSNYLYMYQKRDHKLNFNLSN